MHNELRNSQVPLPVAASGASIDAQHEGDASTAVQLLRRALATFLAKDIQGFAALCDANVVMEFPFAPDEASRKMVGRTAIYEYLKDYPTIIHLRATRSMHIHATEDPELAIAEWSVSGEVIGNGNPYEMRYATFATFKNGLIVNYREYWNPIAFIAAMDGTTF